MGQKVHPFGFRLGYIYDWQSKWFAGKNYTDLLHEDLSIRRTITQMLPDAGISRVEIDRNANLVTVTIHTARPGIVIGRGGQRVDEVRNRLEQVISDRRIRVNISEIRVPELDAALVARAVADQLERRVSHRRAMKQAVARTMQRGGGGIKVRLAGRLGGSDMSRVAKDMDGRVPLHTLRADIDYGTAEARTTTGRIGVKVWLFKGEIIKETKPEVPPGTTAEPPAEEQEEQVPATPEAGTTGEPAIAEAPKTEAETAVPSEPEPDKDATAQTS